MSEPSETSGRPLASNIHHAALPSQQQPPYHHNRATSQSSDERVGGTQSTPSRRRPGTRKEASSLGPHLGSSRCNSSTMQRSASPTQLSPEMSSVNYTRTGRISKAKKGLKVHNCDECGRVSYTIYTNITLLPFLCNGLAERNEAQRRLVGCTMHLSLSSLACSSPFLHYTKRGH